MTFIKKVVSRVTQSVKPEISDLTTDLETKELNLDRANPFSALNVDDLSADEVIKKAYYLKKKGFLDASTGMLIQYVNSTDVENNEVNKLLLNWLIEQQSYSKAFNSWHNISEPTHDKFQLMKSGFKIFYGQITSLEKTADTMIDNDALNFALEVSLLRKVDPKGYTLTKDYIINCISKWYKREDFGIEALRLSIEDNDHFRENSFQKLRRILGAFVPWQLSKLFRYPLFQSNAKLILDFCDFLLTDTAPLIDRLSPKAQFNLLVLGYAIFPTYKFNEYLRKLRLTYSQEKIEESLCKPESALCSISKAFLLPEDKAFILNTVTKSSRLRLAICISGQMRGFEAAFESWRHLGLDHHNVDFYIHTWEAIGRRFPDPDVNGTVQRVFDSPKFCEAYLKCGRLFGIEAIQQAYPGFFSSIEKSAVITQDRLQEVYGTLEGLVIEKENQAPFSSYDNQQKMHYKIFSVMEMVKATDKKYDLVIRIRPDKSFNEQNVPIDWHSMLTESRERSVVFSEEPLGLRENLVMGDQYAIGSPELIHAYSQAWNFIKSVPKSKPYGVSAAYAGHSSLAYCSLYNGIRSEKRQHIQNGPLKDIMKITEKEILTLLKTDISHRSHIEMDTLLLSALN